MRVSFFVFFISIVLWPFLSSGQVHEYRVLWKGDSIGYVSATLYDSNGYDVYHIHSDVRVWFFGTKRLNTYFHSVFHADELLSGVTYSTKNDQMEYWSSAKRDGDSYAIHVDNNKKQINFDDKIQYSITTLYHQEPVGISKIFSERYGTFLEVIEISPHHYTLEKPNGRLTEYTYRDGICTKVVVENFFITVQFELLE